MRRGYRGQSRVQWRVRPGWASLKRALSVSCKVRHPKKKTKKINKFWPWAGHWSISRRLKSRQGAKQSAHLFTHGMSLPSALALSCIYLAGSAWWTDKHFCCFNQHSHWLCHGVRVEKKYPEQPLVWILSKKWAYFRCTENKQIKWRGEGTAKIFLFILCETTRSDTWMLRENISCIWQMRWRCY